MQFGAMVNTKIDEWQTLKLAEDLGYDSGWVPDSQMIWSDCYAVLALAAANTSRIRLGTGVAIPGTRLAPVTAHSIASVNRLAPGRAFLGIGTGHTAMRVMGMRPMGPAAFREYVRVVRALLHGEEVEFTHQGVTRAIRFQNREMGFIGFDPPVPIHVAANGPKALAIAGELGDGRICAGAEPLGVLSRNVERVREGAAAAGRNLPADFHVSTLTYFCMLRTRGTDRRRARRRGGRRAGRGHPALLVGACAGRRARRLRSGLRPRRLGPLLPLHPRSGHSRRPPSHARPPRPLFLPAGGRAQVRHPRHGPGDRRDWSASGT